MPRTARIVLLNHLYHVTQRGNYRQNIFFEDQDKAVYLNYLEESSQKHGVRIYAFCLMDNHVHFIVQPLSTDSLAKTFRSAHQRYSLYLNKRLKQFGHRWQSRFYSCILLGDHLPKALRYVEQNPVRANIVAKPWQYKWSSAGFRLGKKFKIISLSNIKDFCNVSSWEEFLLCEDSQDDLENIRRSTIQGRAFGSFAQIQSLEKEYGEKLLITKRGRPSK